MAARTITIDVSSILDKNDEETRKLKDQCDQLMARVIAEDREMTTEEEEALTESQEKIVSIRRRSDLLKRQIELDEEMDEPGKPRTQRDRKPGERTGAGEDAGREEREKRYSLAFGNYLRRGLNRMSEEDRSLIEQRFTELPADNPEVRAMSAITGTAGGFTVPEGFVASVEVAMKAFNGVLQSKATVMPTTTGNDLPWPTVNDTNNEGEQVEENQAVSEGDPVLGQVNFRAYLFSSKLILVPIQLMQDTGVNIEQLLTRLMGERLGRITNRRYTTGNGANQPQGIVTGSVKGHETAASTAITYNELVELEHSVDPAYRMDAEWMMHDSTVKVLKQLVDLDGRPIWMRAMVAGMADGAPGLLLDHPYRINQHMATIAAGAKSVLFGQMSKFHVRQVRNMVILRLEERYAEKLQVGFFAFMRADSKLVDAGTNPIKHLLQKP